jgi:hypothetical protein
VVFAALGIAPVSGAQAGNVVDASFGVSGTVDMPGGSFVDAGPAGSVYVVSEGAVRRLDDTGDVDASFPRLTQPRTSAIGADSTGRLYAASIDRTSIEVRRYLISGAIDPTWGTSGVARVASTCSTDGIRDLIVHDDGAVGLVATRTVNGGGSDRYPVYFTYARIVRIDATGAARPDVADVDVAASGCGRTSYPDVSIAPAPSGGVVVAHGGIATFNADGSTRWTYAPTGRAPFRVMGVASDGAVLAHSASWHSAARLSSTGEHVGEVAFKYLGTTLDVLADGSIMTVDAAQGGVRVQRWRPDGTSDASFGYGGSIITCPRTASVPNGVVTWSSVRPRGTADEYYVPASVTTPGGGGAQSASVLMRIVPGDGAPTPPGARIWNVSQNQWSLLSDEPKIYVGDASRLWLTPEGCGGPGVASMRAAWKDQSWDAAAFGRRRSLQEGVGTISIESTDLVGTVGTTTKELVVDYQPPIVRVRRYGSIVNWTAVDRGAAGSTDRGGLALPRKRLCRQHIADVRDRAGNETTVIIRWRGGRVLVDRRPAAIRIATRYQQGSAGWNLCTGLVRPGWWDS